MFICELEMIFEVKTGILSASGAFFNILFLNCGAGL
jgi:hypothetical protein